MRDALVRLSVCVALAACPWSAAASPPAQDSGIPNELAPTLAELMSVQKGLGSPQPEQRREALSGLLELGDQALPTIQARLRALSAKPLEPKQLQQRMASLRRAQGVELTEANFDPASAILTALSYDRSEPMLVLCELIALSRALQAQRSLAAAQVLVSDLFALEPRLLRLEAIRARKRLGKHMIPAFLRHRSDPRPELQKLAREGLTALGVNSDERLFNQHDSELLAATIRALGDAHAASDAPDRRQLASVAWVVAHVDDLRPNVREAARDTTRRFGAAAVEPLRQRITDLTASPPDPAQDGNQLLERLVGLVDAQHALHATGALSVARAALTRGELDEAEGQLDRALAGHPTPELLLAIASAYQELGRRYDNANRPSRALVASRRALRLDPQAKAAQARVLYLEAEGRLRSGIADLTALRVASTLDPEHPAAATLLEELRGVSQQSARALRRLLGFTAAALVALAACLVLYLRRAARLRLVAAERRAASTSPAAIA